MQGNFLLYIFAILSFFATVYYHFGKRSYIKYAHSKECTSAVETILLFGHQVIRCLKYCICRKNLNFGQLYLLMPDKSYDN